MSNKRWIGAAGSFLTISFVLNVIFAMATILTKYGNVGLFLILVWLVAGFVSLLYVLRFVDEERSSRGYVTFQLPALMADWIYVIRIEGDTTQYRFANFVAETYVPLPINKRITIAKVHDNVECEPVEVTATEQKVYRPYGTPKPPR